MLEGDLVEVALVPGHLVHPSEPYRGYRTLHEEPVVTDAGGVVLDDDPLAGKTELLVGYVIEDVPEGGEVLQRLVAVLNVIVDPEVLDRGGVDGQLEELLRRPGDTVPDGIAEAEHVHVDVSHDLCVPYRIAEEMVAPSSPALLRIPGGEQHGYRGYFLVDLGEESGKLQDRPHAHGVVVGTLAAPLVVVVVASDHQAACRVGTLHQPKDVRRSHTAIYPLSGVLLDSGVEAVVIEDGEDVRLSVPVPG